MVEAGQLGSPRKLLEDASLAACVPIVSELGPEWTPILNRRISFIVAANQVLIALAVAGELHLLGVIARDTIVNPAQHVARSVAGDDEPIGALDRQKARVPAPDRR